MKILHYNLTAVNNTKNVIDRRKYYNYKTANKGFQFYKNLYEGDICTIQLTKVYKDLFGFNEEIIKCTEKEKVGTTWFRGDL